MVKSGEVYYTSTTKYEPGGETYLIHSSRPRNVMVPIGYGYMIMAAVQSQLFPCLGVVEPSFIQGKTSE